MAGSEVDGVETAGVIPQPATEDNGDDDKGHENRGDKDDDERLPDTGAGSNQLLIVGIGLMLAGGVAAFAVSRRGGVGQG